MARTINRLSLIAGLAAALGLAAMAPAFGQATSSTQVIRVAFALEAVNECGPAGGEIVVLDGELLIVSHTTADGNSGFHTHFTITVKGEGTGLLTGATYHVSDIASFTVQNPSSGSLAFTQPQQFMLIGQGQVPNQVGHILDHFTLNANGETTASVSDFAFECH